MNQCVAMTGSLSVRGDVLPVGGITPKIEAAAQAGIKEVLIPQSNLNDVLIEERYKDKVKITPVVTIEDVLEPVLIQQGFLMRTPRGRMATRAAYLHFGLTPSHQIAGSSPVEDLFGE